MIWADKVRAINHGLLIGVFAAVFLFNTDLLSVALGLLCGLILGREFPFIAESAVRAAGAAWRWVRGPFEPRTPGVAFFMRRPFAADAAADAKPPARVDFFKAAGNVTAFFVGHWRWIGLALLAAALFFVARPVWRFVSCPFGLCDTREELRGRIDALEARVADAESQARLAEEAIAAAERTGARERIIIQEVEHADHAIAQAADAGDADALYRAYLDGYHRVWNDPTTGREPDHPAPGRFESGLRPRFAGAV